MEKWFVINKGADFEKLGKEFGISPVTARLIRNREVIGEAAFERYLNGSLKDLYDPHLLKDADRLTDILKVKIEEQKPIRIIGDYDIDVNLYFIPGNPTLWWKCFYADSGSYEGWLWNQ